MIQLPWKSGGRYDWRSWRQRRRSDQLWGICKHDDFLIHWEVKSVAKWLPDTLLTCPKITLESTVVSSGISAYILWFLHLYISTSLYEYSMISIFYILIWLQWEEIQLIKRCLTLGSKSPKSAISLSVKCPEIHRVPQNMFSFRNQILPFHTIRVTRNHDLTNKKTKTKADVNKLFCFKT